MLSVLRMQWTISNNQEEKCEEPYRWTSHSKVFEIEKLCIIVFTGLVRATNMGKVPSEVTLSTVQWSRAFCMVNEGCDRTVSSTCPCGPCPCAAGCKPCVCQNKKVFGQLINQAKNHYQCRFNYVMRMCFNHFNTKLKTCKKEGFCWSENPVHQK